MTVDVIVGEGVELYMIPPTVYVSPVCLQDNSKFINKKTIKNAKINLFIFHHQKYFIVLNFIPA